jgi:TonB family protein
MVKLAVALLTLSLAAQDERVYESKEVWTLPVIAHEVKPKYSPDAMRAGVVGEVTLEGVVRTDGHVTDVRVVRPLHPDLDREAVDTFRKWEFKPGLSRNGQAVAVRISVMMSFTLRDSPDPVFEPGGDITTPTIVSEVKPEYPDADRAAGRTGVVGLECVVRRNGACSEIVVTKPLYPSLDEAAVAALKQWRFKPGTRGLTDVSVRIQLTMSFDLR